MATITVIDDSSATISMLSSILQQGNHDVVAYTDPTDVETRIAASPPDLVLLDIVMPERNGYEVLRALRRNPATESVPVILVSSKSEETDIRWGKRQGAVDYITKPFTPEAVLDAVRQHV